MKKIWLEGKSENTTYYYLASEPYTHKIYKKSDMSEKDIQEIIDKKGFLNKDWGNYFDVVFANDNKTVSKDAIELPIGCYRLKPNDGKPLRLEVMNVREENYIPLNDHKTLLYDIQKFLNSRSLYEHLEFIYRRGYLFYGEPGTGKTAFIRHLAHQEYFSNSHRIWLDFVPPGHFVQALNATESMKIIVMEELLQEDGRLGYEMSRLLEFMDGENAIKDCITIATTNYPQYLHKNLADRPSRFDVLFEMKTQPVAVLKTIIEKWLNRPIQDNELSFSNYSLAQLKEIVLLHKFYDISLNEAANRLDKQSEKFNTNFAEKKTFGFGFSANDED